MISWHRQSMRFAAVGIGSNLLLYLLYLILTSLGVGHKTAMSCLYLLGLVQTFLLNKTWTFAHQGKMHAALGRYLIAYGLGYLLNLGMLHLLVDRFGLPHLLIQGLAIFVVAVTMFLLQRHWVFTSHNLHSFSGERR